MTTSVPEAVRPRPSAIPQIGELGAYHACWYPIALSTEIAPGQVKGTPFLGGRVVVYRTEAGAVYVKSAYCRHLGADLSDGAVIGDKLRCPFHHWSYGESGACVEVPAGDPPPPKAKLFSYPTAESLGIIWAFNGEASTYPVPHFNTDEAELTFDAFRNPQQMHAALPTVFLNAFDLQHFKVIHGLDIEAEPDDLRREGDILHYSVRVGVPEFGKVVQERKLWAVNAVTVELMRSGRRVLMLHGLCPLGPQETIGFLVNATVRDAAEAGAAPVDQVLAEARAYTLRFINEDADIFNHMRFRADCLTKADQVLGFGLRYIASFPPSNPGEHLIT